MPARIEKEEEMATTKRGALVEKGDSVMAEKEKYPTQQHHPEQHHPEHGGKHVATTTEDVELLVASTNMIQDATTVAAMTPTAPSQVNAINPNGPIMDISGNVGLVQIHLKETAALLNYIKTATDAADPQLAKINGVLGALTGGGGPSAAAITDLTAALTTGPTVPTQTKSVQAAGPILDWTGNVNGANIMLKEAKYLISKIIFVLDAGDPMKTLLSNINQTLV